MWTEEECSECGGEVEVEVYEEPITQFEWIREVEKVCKVCGYVESDTQKIKKWRGY